jgi:hypothetical protein
MHTTSLVHPMVKRVQEEVTDRMARRCLDGQYFTGGGWFQSLGPQVVGDGGDGDNMASIFVAEIC